MFVTLAPSAPGGPEGPVGPGWPCTNQSNVYNDNYISINVAVTYFVART